MTTVTEVPPPPGVTRDRVRVRDDEVSILRGGTGPTTMFLHGSGGAGMWTPFHAALSVGTDLVAPDHPGFGGSDEFAGVRDVQDLAFHYADLLAALDLESVNLVGSSFGGWIAAELAAYRPNLVDRLVLINPIGLYIDGAPIRDLFAMPPEQKIAALVGDPSVLAALFPAEPDLDTILAMAKDEAAFARFAWKPFCHDPRLPRLLPRITAPTLILWGDRDALIPNVHGERYAQLITDGRLQLLGGLGHAPTLERPDVVADLVSRFVLQN